MLQDGRAMKRLAGEFACRQLRASMRFGVVRLHVGSLHQWFASGKLFLGEHNAERLDLVAGVVPREQKESKAIVVWLGIYALFKH